MKLTEAQRYGSTGNGNGIYCYATSPTITKNIIKGFYTNRLAKPGHEYVGIEYFSP